MTPEDAVTLQAYLTGIDETVRLAEQRWGMERLPRLVDDELRAKFNRQVLSWQTALEEAWSAKFLTANMLAAVKAKGAAMQRAWGALDAAATAAGHRPIAPWVWEVTLEDGTVAAIVQTDAEVGKVIADGRHLVVYTLAEIGRLLDAVPKTLVQAKQAFPGARVVPPARREQRPHAPGVPFSDDIPFGDEVAA
jgi:hypothetical protein